MNDFFVTASVKGAVEEWWVTLGLLLFILSLYWVYGFYTGSKWYRGKSESGWQERLRSNLGLPVSLWSGLDYEQRCVVRDVWATCNANGVKMALGAGPMVGLSGTEAMVSGYFSGDEDGSSPVLSVGAGKDPQSFIEVLLHESCHMDQWAEGSDVWKGLRKGGRDCYDILWDWLESKVEMEESRIEDVVSSCMACELDCERRVLEKIVRYGLDISVEQYAQKSNSYIWGYYVTKLRKRWYSVPPYEVGEVWGRMPKRLMRLEEFMRMDWETLTYYDRFCFGGKGRGTAK